VEVSYIFTTCPWFDNLEFDVIDVGCPQCHFITSIAIAVVVVKNNPNMLTHER